MSENDPAWKAAHDAAIKREELVYVDPSTGYQVFSELGLKARGKCCGSGCRHCPYNHEAVKKPQAKTRPKFLSPLRPESAEPTALFWSGGKDSFLALCTLLEKGTPVESIVLMTTYDPAINLVAHQEINIADVQKQAKVLGLPLLGVPLIPGEDYLGRIELGLEHLKQQGCCPRHLAFGDLHLEHVLSWRNANLAPLAMRFNANLLYPVLNVDYPALLRLFEDSQATATVSASTAKDVIVGTEFTRVFTESLPPHIDAFGERGEFHTLLQPKDSAKALQTRLNER